MTGAELKAWRAMVGLSQPAAGEVLGYTRKGIQLLEREKELRACIPLACAAYALGIRDYNGPDIQAKLEKEKRKK